KRCGSQSCSSVGRTSYSEQCWTAIESELRCVAALQRRGSPNALQPLAFRATRVSKRCFVPHVPSRARQQALLLFFSTSFLRPVAAHPERVRSRQNECPRKSENKGAVYGIKMRPAHGLLHRKVTGQPV